MPTVVKLADPRVFLEKEKPKEAGKAAQHMLNACLSRVCKFFSTKVKANKREELT